MVPKIRTKGYGGRPFSYASATVWNELCDACLTEAGSVTVFKGRLNLIFSIVTFPQSHSLTLSCFVIVYMITLCCLNLCFYSFSVCFICILNCTLFVCKLFIWYLCVIQRFEFFLKKCTIIIIFIIIKTLLHGYSLAIHTCGNQCDATHAIRKGMIRIQNVCIAGFR